MMKILKRTKEGLVINEKEITRAAVFSFFSFLLIEVISENFGGVLLASNKLLIVICALGWFLGYGYRYFIVWFLLLLVVSATSLIFGVLSIAEGSAATAYIFLVIGITQALLESVFKK